MTSFVQRNKQNHTKGVFQCDYISEISNIERNDLAGALLLTQTVEAAWQGLRDQMNRCCMNITVHIYGLHVVPRILKLLEALPELSLGFWSVQEFKHDSQGEAAKNQHLTLMWVHSLPRLYIKLSLLQHGSCHCFLKKTDSFEVQCRNASLYF